MPMPLIDEVRREPSDASRTNDSWQTPGAPGEPASRATASEPSGPSAPGRLLHAAEIGQHQPRDRPETPNSANAACGAVRGECSLPQSRIRGSTGDRYDDARDFRTRTNPVTPGPSHRATGIAPVAGCRAAETGMQRWSAAYAERLGHSGAGASTTEFGATCAAIDMSPLQSSGAAPARGQKQSRRAEAARARIWATARATSYWARPRSGRLLFGEALARGIVRPVAATSVPADGVVRVLPRDCTSPAR